MPRRIDMIVIGLCWLSMLAIPVVLSLDPVELALLLLLLLGILAFWRRRARGHRMAAGPRP
jgi:MYXO-CTERM domain-containing protein